MSEAKHRAGELVDRRMSADMKRLEQLSEAGRMWSVMSHEIRNPLAGIRALAESIVGEAGEHGLADVIELIIEDVDRLEGLLKEYSTMIRRGPPRRRLIDLEEVVEAARAACASRLEGRELSLELGTSRVAWVDPDQVKQALINLLLNAAEATPVDGEITIRVQDMGKETLLQVADSGAGIPRDNLQRVMDVLFSTKANRAGLGLAVCFRIVKDHGGRFDIASEVGEGTTVTATFPNCEPE